MGGNIDRYLYTIIDVKEQECRFVLWDILNREINLYHLITNYLHIKGIA